jgi:outer membrane receptor protein involved in Fe transport
MQQLSGNKFQLLPISAAVSAAFTGASGALAQEESLTLEEVIVTARKRTESVQDIPSSIQAISGENLKEMGARGMSDFIRFMPSVNMVSYGAGVSSVIFRGATVDGGGYVAQAPSSVYLDEVSITSTGDQPAVRMVDIERVEALAGPQGTIYGSDAQAGTLRIITNKPEMNKFQVDIEGSIRDGSDSEESWDGSVVVNLPIIEDTLALRVLAFAGEDGGFVDNVPGHTPDVNVVGGPGGLGYPAGFGTLDNSAYVEKGINDSEVKGWRAALKWDINDNWSATLGAIYQETDSGAENFHDPYVGDLEVVRFFDDFRDDEYDLYSLTIEGDLGFAQLVSATSYYDRESEYRYDITAYQHYWSGAYCHTYDLDPSTYYWYFPSPDGNGVVFWPVYCLSPTVDGDYFSTIHETAQQERFTQEIRLSSSGDTFDWLAGIYYEDSTNAWQSHFAGVHSNDYQDSVSLDYWEWAEGQSFPEGKYAWDSDSDTDWEQWAVFGELVWHATDRLDITLGGRYFDRENVNLYYVERPNTNLLPEYRDGIEEHKGDETEFAPKVAVSYNFTDDVMGYALYSVGYRPGGTNRSRGQPFFPNNYEPDEMTNYELGVRSTIMDGAGRLNATFFYMDWEDYQLELVDPSYAQCPDGGSVAGVCGQPWQITIGNVGDAHIMGFNVEFDWAINRNWVFGMNAEWLEAENDSDVDLTADGVIDPTSGDVADGQELPTVADWTGSTWLNFEVPIESFGDAFFARLQWSYRGESYNTLEPTEADGNFPNPQLKNDSYDQGDLYFGVRGERWELSFFVENLTDERGTYTTESGLFEWSAASSIDGRAHTQKDYLIRPREYGMRFRMSFGD